MNRRVMETIDRAVLMAALVLALGCEPENTPPPLDPGPNKAQTEEIHLAGAEEATSLFRHLARVFSARTPGGPIIVHDPVGSAGALGALESGLLAGALVAGPVASAHEQAGTRVARSEVVIALGSGIENRHLTASELVQTMRGEDVVWGSGLTRRFLLTSVDEPALRALSDRSQSISDALNKSGFRQRWTRVSASEAIGERVARTPGSLAIVDLGNLRLRSAPVWISRLEELSPIFIELRLVTGKRMPDRLRAFLDFIIGPDGQALVSDLGFSGEGSQ